MKIITPFLRNCSERICILRSRSGMELVQVAILVAIAVALGLIFRTQITDFVNRTFEGLNHF
jgi:hypothetical protein